MNSMPGVLLILSVVLVPIALVIWVKRRQARATQSPEIEAEYVRAGIELKTSGIFGRRLAAGTLQGVQFAIEIHPDRGGAAVLTTPTALTGSFTVASESDSDRYFKRIGLTSEVQTGDAEFDREVYLCGGPRDYLASLFGQSQARDAVRALLRLDYVRIVLGDGVLSAYKPWCTKLPKLDTLRPALERLAALGATPGVQAVAKRAAPISLSALIMGVSVVLLIAGFILLDHATWRTQPFADGVAAMMHVWPAVAAACLAFAGFAVFLLRGRPLAHVEIGAIIFVALPGLCMVGWGAAMLANQHLDESAPRERHTQVEDRDHSRKLRSPIVVLAPWRDGGGSVRVPVSAGTHKNLQAGQRWIMRTRSGWLGYEWVESARPATEK